MTDYRASIKSELAELDKQRESLLSALGVLDQIDSGVIRNKTSSKRPEATDGTLIDTVLNILRDQTMTTNDLYERVIPRARNIQGLCKYSLVQAAKARKDFQGKKSVGIDRAYGFHRAAAAALAISLRRSGVRDSVRAFPPRLARSRLKAGLSCLNDWPLSLISRSLCARREQHTLCLQWVSIRPSVL